MQMLSLSARVKVQASSNEKYIDSNNNSGDVSSIAGIKVSTMQKVRVLEIQQNQYFRTGAYQWNKTSVECHYIHI